MCSNSKSKCHVQVAVPVPLYQSFTYSLDQQEQSETLIGRRVLVDFKNRLLVGLVTSEAHTNKNAQKDLPYEIKPLIKVLDEKPIFDREFIALCEWMSSYYATPLGEVFRACLPQKLNGDTELKELVTELAKKSEREPKLLKEPAKILSEEQSVAFKQIQYHNYQCYLLNGVTGSGKTEIYLQAAARTLQTDKQVLVLIPEINLSQQTVKRFTNRFNTKVIELHSNVAEKKRALNWLAARSGEAKIVIGTRLSALAPMANLGLIIVDEEHDSSYKQQDGFRYSARDVSHYRANKQNIPIILGSATPSVESWQKARNNSYKHLILKERANLSTPATIELVDTREKKLFCGIESSVLKKILAAYERGEQVLVFLNKRGFAATLYCEHCGWHAECHSCDAGLHVHHQPQNLHCHHCDWKQPLPKQCPACHSYKLATQGVGTEQVELGLREHLPAEAILRFDSDSVSSKRRFNAAMTRIHSEQPCVIVGTQMLAKGHHIKKLSLVVVLNSDQGFFSPNHRIVERTGQTITQVMGRAGREKKSGRVILQTLEPDNTYLQLITRSPYEAFIVNLSDECKRRNLPPFSYRSVMLAESKTGENAQKFLTDIKMLLAQQPLSKNMLIFGPYPAQLARRKNLYTFELHLQSSIRSNLNFLHKKIISTLQQDAQQNSNAQITLEKNDIHWSLDVDPV